MRKSWVSRLLRGGDGKKGQKYRTVYPASFLFGPARPIKKGWLEKIKSRGEKKVKVVIGDDGGGGTSFMDYIKRAEEEEEGLPRRCSTKRCRCLLDGNLPIF